MRGRRISLLIYSIYSIYAYWREWIYIDLKKIVYRGIVDLYKIVYMGGGSDWFYWFKENSVLENSWFIENSIYGRGRWAEQCSAIFPVISLSPPFPCFNTTIYISIFLFTMWMYFYFSQPFLSLLWYFCSNFCNFHLYLYPHFLVEPFSQHRLYIFEVSSNFW